MELREVAERVLFATTLSEKLWCPDVVTDERPGPALEVPEAPGRPRELRFKTRGSAPSDFPGLHRLEQERERGRLLHFFANHELLATELMALVLLRFPDAPTAFRRDVLRTLQDEQGHTQLYLQRMKDSGLQFGELPVSGYFWRSVSPMENPMDYVAGLSLTFEQANLDFCRQFSRGFEAVGDDVTARLLEKIYRDEIGHVAYGLKWFRRWKNPDASDWEAFCRHLKFPLSPQRAKGNTLNIEGRLAAGIDPAFIAELNVYSQSKGRTPSVFVFNPFAEGRIAQGKSFTPVKHQARLASDLENLPQFLCRQDDIVLVRKRPSVEFLSGIKQAGFPLPEFLELEGEGLKERKLGRLRPWAWGPDAVEMLEPLFESVTGEDRPGEQRYNEDVARLYSKAWSAELLEEVLRSRPGSEERVGRSASKIALDAEELRRNRENTAASRGRSSGVWADESWLCSEQEVGVAVDTPDAAFEAIAAIRRRGHHKIVAKEALGLAGHNAIRLWEPDLLDSQRKWIANAVACGQQLVIEPWLEREIDFSIQVEMEPGGLKLCGYTGLINDRKGQFQANWAGPNCDRRIPSIFVASISDSPEVCSKFKRLYSDIFSLLGSEFRRAGYLGPAGIDAFVYRTPEGDRRLKPIVEINPRYTMGRLTVELMKRTCPGSYGMFRLVSRTRARTAGFTDFDSYARSLCERLPIHLEGEPVPRIREGTLCLNDPVRAQACLSVFQVGRSFDTVLNGLKPTIEL